MEHALMNYLYLQLYVHKETVELFFNLSAAVDGTRHYVKIIESPDVIIKRVEISGKDWTNFNAEECCLVLPKGKGMKVKVVLGIR